ncbi:MAG: transposase [Planctomycetota bacterium]|nr:transposase [Planctomycetota bacterium]
MPDPLGFLLTWTTYGTWLPGDERGWVWKGHGFQWPDPILKQAARKRMTEPACTLDDEQRDLVEKTIREHCDIRKWHLHAVSCRTNHVHVVVSAHRDPEDLRDQLKAWCTRKLKDLQRSRSEPLRENWWTERGSQRHLGDAESLEAAIVYVRDGQ